MWQPAHSSQREISAGGGALDLIAIEAAASESNLMASFATFN